MRVHLRPLFSSWLCGTALLAAAPPEAILVVVGDRHSAWVAKNAPTDLGDSPPATARLKAAGPAALRP